MSESSNCSSRAKITWLVMIYLNVTQWGKKSYHTESSNQISLLFLPTNDIEVSLCHGLSILVVSPAGVTSSVPHLHILDQQRVDLIVKVQQLVPLSRFNHLSILHPVYRQHTVKHMQNIWSQKNYLNMQLSILIIFFPAEQNTKQASLFLQDLRINLCTG